MQNQKSTGTVSQSKPKQAKSAREPSSAGLELVTTPSDAERKTQPDLLQYDCNDHGNCQRLIALHGDELRYCHAFKKWVVYDGCRWAVDRTEQARKLARLTILRFAFQAVAKQAPTSAEFAHSCLNVGPITNMLRMAQSEIFIQPAELDLDPYLLNFKNGTVDLRTGKCGPHRYQDFITKLVNHDYRASASCDLWLKFLDGIMGGSNEMIAYLQKAIGYSLTGSTIEKAVFVPFGSGNNGKTTMLALIRKLLGEYAALVQINTLMTKHENSNTQSDLADLRGARFVMTSETEDGQRLAQGKLKRITQGMGTIKAIRKYENTIEFPETHKIWMDTNRRPMITDADDQATFNRLHPIPFTVTIPKSEIDRKLPGKLFDEAEGILAWAVKGAKLTHKFGLDKPPEVEIANEQWRAESDKLNQFVKECCAEGGGVPADVFYDAYFVFAKDNDLSRVLNQKEFAAKMEERPGIKKRRTKNGVIYEGLSLRVGWTGRAATDPKRKPPKQEAGKKRPAKSAV